MRAMVSVGAVAILFLTSGCGDSKPAVKTGKEAPVSTAKSDAKAEPAPKPAGTPEEKKPGEAAVSTTAAGETATVQLGDSGRSITVPKSWKQQEPESKMRMAEFKVPKAEGDAEDGDLSIFRMFGGGGTDANIDRWASQMGGKDSLKSKRNMKTAAGQEAIVVDLEGTYTAMTFKGTGTPQAGYKMLGAVIITDKGEFYIKVAGPKNTIDANKKAFDAMVESFK